MAATFRSQYKTPLAAFSVPPVAVQVFRRADSGVSFSEDRGQMTDESNCKMMRPDCFLSSVFCRLSSVY
jgi:hypothetical protein